MWCSSVICLSEELSGFHIDTFYSFRPTLPSSPSPNSQSEEEEDVFGMTRRRSSLGLSGYPLTEEEPETREPRQGALRRIISIEEDPLPQLLDGSFQPPLSKCPEEENESDQRVEGDTQQVRPSPLELVPTSPRGQPVGKEALCQVRARPATGCRRHPYAAPKAAWEVSVFVFFKYHFLLLS